MSEPTICAIQTAVSETFHTPLIDMRSHRQGGGLTLPRQVAMYLARELTLHSLPAIGRAFGGRDHTTVMHALKQVEMLASADPDLGERIISLRERFGDGRVNVR